MRAFVFLCAAGCLFAQCPANPGSAPGTTESWGAWGNGDSNSRFQPADRAGIAAGDVPDLKLKWAFGFPGVRSMIGAPTVEGGWVYIGTDNGTVYALDAKTGCQYWSFKADAGVRNVTFVTAVVPGHDSLDHFVVFGDQKANVYALSAAFGSLDWKVKVDDHPRALITGAPVLGSKGRLYVPVASGEEGAGPNPNYPCCTFRGSVVALDAVTGKQIWKTYTIAAEPKQTGKNSNGALRWAPAGGGVWNSPTIDEKRHALYIGTGDAYTSPAAPTTDSIMAMDLDTGKILWSVQDTSNDTWLAGCTPERHGENCPKDIGPDHDFGSPPILQTIGGRDLLIAGQKSGNVWAHDPDKNGAVVWKTPLVADTTQFGGKIIWGGAADGQNAYFGLGTGGIGAVHLQDGEKQWFAALTPAAAMAAHIGQDGPLTAIPGVVFSGGWDGVLRALSTASGKVLWQYDTTKDYETVNGVAAKGGSMGAAGPVVAGGTLFVSSGYVGVKNGMPGNVLLAFTVKRGPSQP